MDFLGLLWVASFLNQDVAALTAVVWPDIALGQPVNSFFTNGLALVNAKTAGTLGSQPALFAPSSQAFIPLPSASGGQTAQPFSLLNLPGLSPPFTQALVWTGSQVSLNRPQIPPDTPLTGLAASFPETWSLAEAMSMALLPGDKQAGEPRQRLLEPQLPDLPDDAVDWSVWDAVANVTVVKVAAGSHKGADIAFLKAEKQCVAMESTLVSQPANAKASAKKPRYQIWVHDVPVGEVQTAETAYQIATKIRRLIQADALQPADFKPLLGDSFAAGGHNSEILFVVDRSMLPTAKTNPALVASQWINNLRVAFGEDPMELTDVQMIAYGLKETRQRFQGTASWYGPYFHGRKTATGEIFNQHELTAAHPNLPFGTYLKVRNLRNGKSIVVRVNDRGPYFGNRSLDLSYAAAQCLGSEQVGVIPYEATILKPGIPARWNGSLVAGLHR